MIKQVTWALAVTFCIFWFVKSHVYIYHVLKYNYADVGFLGLKTEMEPMDLDQFLRKTHAESQMQFIY